MVLKSLLLGVGLVISPLVIVPQQAFADDVKFRTPASFAELTKKLAPAVVNISTAQTVEIDKSKAFPKGSPLERFNDFFNGGGDENRVARSLGSGFVVDKDGYIVTNNHVIDGADTIEVAFPNGDSFEATLIGRDPSTDIALLKIEAGHEVPYVEFARENAAEVGEWVIAIGNPLGYSSSVAAGIVSANHRNISQGNYDDFIQTDVAINKGNSGGPLFNMDGQVIGVNTAIVSPTGFSVGLSFSIASDLAATVVDQLREFGETRRGFLGVRVQEVSKGIAKSYRLKTPHGALIRSVTEDSPAAKAGLKRGDLITSIGGKELKKSSQLARIIAETKINAPVKVEYVRKRKRKSVMVTIEQLEEKFRKSDLDKPKAGKSGLSTTVAGISVEPLDDKIRARFNLDDDITGVVVTKISTRSDASGKIRKGDIILEVGQEAVEDPEDFTKKMKAAAESEEPILMLVSRGGVPYFYSVKPVA